MFTLKIKELLVSHALPVGQKAERKMAGIAYILFQAPIIQNYFSLLFSIWVLNPNSDLTFYHKIAITIVIRLLRKRGRKFNSRWILYTYYLKCENLLVHLSIFTIKTEQDEKSKSIIVTKFTYNFTQKLSLPEISDTHQNVSVEEKL